MLSSTATTNFNSIKVRLKPSEDFRLSALLSSFQFHKGTIKTRPRNCLRIALTYFNSIKVRLKHDARYLLRTKMCYFNSIKVRLKPFATLIPYKACTFQFHKGTIKTVCEILRTSHMLISIP